MFSGNVYILYDGQAGSCGKGKFVGLFARKFPIDISINNNPPNAGHTFIFDNGKKVVTTHLPIAVVSPNVKFLIIGAGAVINPKLLVSEIKKYKHLIGNRKVYLHKNATIVLPKHRNIELEKIRTGSTFKGTAAALCDKIMRNENAIAGTYNWINEFDILSKTEIENNIALTKKDIKNVESKIINKNNIAYAENENIAYLKDDIKQVENNTELKKVIQIIDDSFIENILSGKNGFTGKENILIETSQGFDLDINHGLEYPYVTSRQCSPAQALADCGLPHNINTKTFMIFRPYPIRISNNTEIGSIYSGDYNGSPEISWKDIEEESLCKNIEQNEMTTITKQLRRVFEFNKERFSRAIRLTNPDYLILNFAQYVNYNIAGLNNKNLSVIEKKWHNQKLCANMDDETYAFWAEKHYGVNVVNAFCYEIENEFNKKILYVGTGAEESCFIDRTQQSFTEKKCFIKEYTPGL